MDLTLSHEKIGQTLIIIMYLFMKMYSRVLFMVIFDLSKKIAILILFRMYALYVKQFVEQKIENLFEE